MPLVRCVWGLGRESIFACYKNEQETNMGDKILVCGLTRSGVIARLSLVLDG